MRRIRLGADARATLEHAGASAEARERCGVLLGVRLGEACEVRLARPTRNRSEAADAFVCDAGDVVAAARAAEELGLELLGAWHTHRGGDGTPSTAAARGAWEGLLTLVVVTAPRPRLRAWRCAGGAALEVPIAT